MSRMRLTVAVCLSILAFSDCDGVSIQSATVVTLQDGVSIEPMLFGVNDIIGPVNQMSYSSPQLMQTATSISLGGLRYPGGTVANYWNITSGRYVDNCNASCCSEFGSFVNKFPLGTFTLANMVSGMAKYTMAGKPVIDLNCLTLSSAEVIGQLDLLSPACAGSECLIELGNELYLNSDDYVKTFPTVQTYVDYIKPIVAEIRKKFPKALISVPAGNSGSVLALAKNPKPQNRQSEWILGLAKNLDLFDAITIHDYTLNGQTLSNKPENDLPSIVAAFPEGLYKRMVEALKPYFSSKQYWFTEYNTGKGTGYLASIQGTGLHGLHVLSHVMVGMQYSANIKVMFYHSLLSVTGVDWDHRGMIHLDSFNGNRLYNNGVSQLFAHVNHIANTSDMMHGVDLKGGPMLPNVGIDWLENMSCVQAVAFTTGTPASNIHYVVINRCTGTPLNVSIQLPSGGSWKGQRISYDISDLNTGNWTAIPELPQVFPWPVPVPSTTTIIPSKTEEITIALDSLTLNVISLL